MALTGRTALVAALGALLVLAVGGWGVLGVELALLVAVVVDIVLAGAVSDLAFTRSGATTVRLGETATVTLTVTNTGARRMRGTLRDAWVPSAGVHHSRHRLELPAGAHGQIDTELSPTRRGDRRADTVTVRSVGPLGLAARQRGRVVPWSVRVLPAFASRRHLPARLDRLRQLDGAVATRVRGQGSEFDSLRDYVIGDDVRSIDWRASARRDAVVVRTWRPERDRRVLLVLDTGRTSAGRIGDTPRLDWSLDAALLLAALASRAGDQVDLLAVDRTRRASVEGARSREVLPRLVTAMAPLEPALVEPDYGLLAAEVLRRARHRCLVVLFTGLDAAAVQAGLLPVLPALTERHLVLVAAVADPHIAELAAGRDDGDAVYAAAAAEGARQERRRVIVTLRRRGVEVVDAVPAELAPAVADTYLALKAAGRL